MCWVLFVQNAGCLAPLMGSGGLWRWGADTGLPPAPAGAATEGKVLLWAPGLVPTQPASAQLGGP